MSGKAMEVEIRRQAEILHSQSAEYLKTSSNALRGREFEMIVLVARGSSDHAALYARYLFEIHLQVPVVLAAPSVLTKYGARVRYSNALAIGISQSGAAPDVAEVLDSMRRDGHTTIAITNTPGSRVVGASEFVLELGCGEERSVAATMTYTASLLALYQVARSLGANLPEPEQRLPDGDWIEFARETAIKSTGALLRSHTLFALARGYDFCSAFETALKLMECALISCKAYSSADFAHGPRVLAGHGTAAVVFGEPIAYLADQGCEQIAVPPTPVSVPASIAPIWNIVFGQWLALGAARARGLDPDDPRFIDKVTETL